MTPTRTLDAAGRSGIAAHWLLKAFRRLIAAIRREREIRRASAHLHSLDDRMLADIGIPHGHISERVRYGRDWQGRTIR